MPLYQYENTRTGETVELSRSVAQRHKVPNHLKLILVAGHGGLNKGTLWEQDADIAVPRALKQLEAQHGASEIARRTGWSINHLQKTWPR